MKKMAILGFMAAGLVLSPLMAGHGDSAKNRRYSDRYQRWSEENQQSGLFQAMQAKPLTETGLLLQLDKEGRQKFRNLPRHTRLEVLEIVNQSGTKEYMRVIDETIERESQKVERDQERMLHNGMDRLQHQ